LRYRERRCGPLRSRGVEVESRAGPTGRESPFAAEVLAGCARQPVELRRLVQELAQNKAPKQDTRVALAEMGVLAARDPGRRRRQRTIAIGLGVVAAGLGGFGVMADLSASLIPVAAAGLGAAAALGLRSRPRDRETGLGLLTRRQLRRSLRQGRQWLLDRSVAEPHDALREYIANLAWFAVDSHLRQGWWHRFRANLRGTAAGEAALPGWLVIEGGAPEDAAKLVDTLARTVLSAATGGGAAGPGGGGDGGGGAGGGGGGGG